MLQRYKMYQEPNKSILIIKSEFLLLHSSEQYLAKRDWNVRTTYKLHEAILYITRYAPKFILISIDHENKNIKNFIRILMAMFPDRVLVFAEKPHVLTYHYFNELGGNYNIYPPISGPAIERTLLAYYKGQVSKGQAEFRIFKGPQWNKILQNEAWMYKGKKPLSEQQLISSKKARELLTLVDEKIESGSVDHRAKFDPSFEPELQFDLSAEIADLKLQMLEEEAAERAKAKAQAAEEEKTKESSKRNAPLFPLHKPEPKLIHALPAVRTKATPSVADAALPVQVKSKSALKTAAGKVNGVPHKDGTNGKVDKVASAIAPEGEVSKVDTHLGALGKTKNVSSEISADGALKKRDLEAALGSLSSKELSAETGEVENKRGKRFDHEERVLSGYKYESLISRAAQEALDKTVRRSNASMIELVENSSEVSCIVIESTRFEGYLVAAIGHNREPDAALIETLRQKIFNFLRANGEHIKDEDAPMLVSLKRVDFKRWAEAEADFLRKSEHEQEEITIAFFPREQIHLKFEDSADVQMVKVRMDELKADVPVDFNLYIYLEENRRYVRYTAKGGKLQSHQKERLQKQGLSHMHLYKSELPGLQKFRAQNYLNEKIDHFHASLGL